MKRKICLLLIGMFLLMAGCGRASTSPTSVSVSGIPKQVSDVIFGKSKFSVPATLGLPNAGGIYVHDKALDVLVNHGLARIEKTEERISGGPYPPVTFYYEFLSYTDAIKPYLYEGEVGDLYSYHLRLASRTIKSIDYKNQRQEDSYKIYAITFSYTLKKDFPYYDELPTINESFGRTFENYQLAPDLNRTYKGEAQAMWNPNTGQWELVPTFRNQ